jgi:L-2-hydroxycarboxylate dehydrogenase (NAD+)
MPEGTGLRVRPEVLFDFCVRTFVKTGVTEEDARIAADILIAADLNGVVSHGVAHLKRYVDGMRAGTIMARPDVRVITETPATATIDGGAGLGPTVAYRAMQKAIQKARDLGVGFVSVRNSNHYGIAGYYARMALEHDCIGLSMTNASPKVAPTFSVGATLATNPIAVAVPAGKEMPFVLDMATSIVAVGKVEIADQLDKPIPAGWVIDQDGLPMTDAHQAVTELYRDVQVAVLPLGGAGEQMGGHKGYGLSLWVDIFSGILSGAGFANRTYPKTKEGKRLPANIGHFFGAWRIDCFRPKDEFKADMDDLIQLLKNAPKAPGHDRIYIHGEKEFMATEKNRREGIPINAKVAGELRALAQTVGIEFDLLDA